MSATASGRTRAVVIVSVAQPSRPRPLHGLVASARSAGLEVVAVGRVDAPAGVRVLSDAGGETLAGRRAAGAAATDAEILVLVDDDLVPEPGALDALLAYAERTPAAAGVGAKILRPDGAVEQAGAVIGRDRLPRWVYAGFPAGHPAVSYSGRVAAVSASAAVVRRPFVERAGGLGGDAAGPACDDIDLSLRLATRGNEVHFCHESVWTRVDDRREPMFTEDAAERFRVRWGETIVPDDLERYERDGLLKIAYSELFPLRFRVSPLLAAPVAERRHEADRVLNEVAEDVLALEQEDARLQAALALGAPRRPTVSAVAQRRDRAAEPRHVFHGKQRDVAAARAGLVSIFIPVKNGGAQLRRLLPALGAQDAAVTIEVVGVDSGSTDDSIDVLRQFGATVVQIDPHEFNHGLTRNLALRYGRGDPIVFLSQNARPRDERWLEALVRALDADLRLAGVCSRVLPPPGLGPVVERDALRDPSAAATVVRRRIASWASYAALSSHELRLLINFHTVSAAVRRRVLARFPFRDVTMGEDILWAREVLEAGYGLANEPTSVVEHGHDYGYAELLERNVDDGRANREVVGRRVDDDDVEPLVRRLVLDDWHHLRELSLEAHELEVRELEAVLRRCAQVVGQWIGSNPDRVPPRVVEGLSLTERVKEGGAPVDFGRPV